LDQSEDFVVDEEDISGAAGVNVNALASAFNASARKLAEEEEEVVDLKTLEENKKFEDQENFADFERTAGKGVTYGQVIQLKHKKSGKFITVTVKEVSELERDSLRVVLEPEGNEGSWFVIAPRFKIRSEGEQVHVRDQVVLVSKKYGVHLHASTRGNRTEGKFT